MKTFKKFGNVFAFNNNSRKITKTNKSYFVAIDQNINIAFKSFWKFFSNFILRAIFLANIISCFKKLVVDN